MTTLAQRRPLSTDEQAVLELLVNLDFAGASELRAQVPHAWVVGTCDCGCATVDLEVDQDEALPARNVTSPIPGEATVLDERREPAGGVIVFLRDGYLSMLEIYSADEPITVWPSMDRLSAYVSSR
jgi:hypothetical protein